MIVIHSDPGHMLGTLLIKVGNFTGFQVVSFSPEILQQKKIAVLKFNTSFGCLLAPTGALIVIVCYYRSRPVFEISSISANKFSFSFEN